jgi:cbb3-type cytochrome oxidase subunit 3
MTVTQWLGVVLFLLFGAGIAFAFRQGMKVSLIKTARPKTGRG